MSRYLFQKEKIEKDYKNGELPHEMSSEKFVKRYYLRDGKKMTRAQVKEFIMHETSIRDYYKRNSEDYTIYPTAPNKSRISCTCHGVAPGNCKC